MFTTTRRLGAVATLTAIAAQLVCGCAALPAALQPTWRSTTPEQPATFRPLKPTAPDPDFVPVEDVNRAFPRRLSDDIDMTMVIEVIALILAIGNAPDSPNKARIGETPEP